LNFLKAGDLLVFNNTRVFRARLSGVLPTGGKVEIFLLHPAMSAGRDWIALGRPGRKLKAGVIVKFKGDPTARVVRPLPDGTIKINFGLSAAEVIRLANRIGSIPVPPYISRAIKSESQYQTVYARKTGSVAAPTAGFHFTRRLLAQIKQRGIQTKFVTLHVGLGTFRPIKTSRLEEHEMHAEWAEAPADTRRALSAAKGRVIAVGTTTVRALEGLMNQSSSKGQNKGWVNLFIKPGYNFKRINGLVTNFHLPKSTLLVLVSAFARTTREPMDAGRKKVLKAYQQAIKLNYHFYSFGDAMLII
ncbi:tRNA preQ1(34) S-adenosylmethionine ribosyltransferase-isomerase QueA, partial [Candidatus Uhrbacteria bacterium]|nr:tRNA preQ1(34) S-adenosylmethionine ribosyltransferase-isomerase QueA [Candidatus Uhrbacteria bacterium]